MKAEDLKKVSVVKPKHYTRTYRRIDGFHFFWLAWESVICKNCKLFGV